MKHVVIKDENLNGWEYGMLRSFERAILNETNGTVVNIPPYTKDRGYLKHFGQSMKRGIYRKYFPKQTFDINADVAWYVLMGPENYRLDLYKGWQNNCKIKILYLYDTLPHQYPTIKRLLSDNSWDILITSFNDAVDDLQKITGREWICIEQAADQSVFQPASIEERVIHFSAYGRRYPAIHEAVMDFCNSNGLYYDYTTHDAKHPTADATELYKQYGWHLSHSLFTFSWPVELTNPQRSGHLRPITCRWFEAAASGTIILGQAPDNHIYDKWLQPGHVIPINSNSTKQEMLTTLEDLWSRRHDLHKVKMQMQKEGLERWTWNERVQRILSYIKK
jgi:hypothetical protein